jgi:hypothetical protein
MKTTSRSTTDPNELRRQLAELERILYQSQGSEYHGALDSINGLTITDTRGLSREQARRSFCR